MISIRFQERVAIVATLVALVGLPVAVFHYGPWQASKSHSVIHLTGVKKDGVWTEAEVHGLNYWWKSFHPATIVLREGEEILLRLSSADVTHTFYVPELHPEPIEVEAGHIVEVLLKAEKAGEYQYYCTAVCGDCHYYMQGIIRVSSSSEKQKSGVISRAVDCPTHDIRVEFSSFIERGEAAYNSIGCVTCHGENGKGGVKNPNYIKESVPQLDLIAERMGIYWKEDAEIVIALLESGVDLEKLDDDPPIDNYYRFLVQFRSMTDKIRLGAPSLQKLIPDGPEPPLSMPSWQEHLSSEDMNAILSYLVDQYPWGDFE